MAALLTAVDLPAHSAFISIDTSRNNSIDVRELQASLDRTSPGQFTLPVVSLLIRLFDEDGSGDISWAEFRTLYSLLNAWLELYRHELAAAGGHTLPGAFLAPRLEALWIPAYLGLTAEEVAASPIAALLESHLKATIVGVDNITFGALAKVMAQVHAVKRLAAMSDPAGTGSFVLNRSQLLRYVMLASC